MNIEREQIMVDLQKKISDDVMATAHRTYSLAFDDEMRAGLMLQATCTLMQLFAAVVEGSIGREPPPTPRTVLITCLMCARAININDDCELGRLLTSATLDARAIEQAGINIDTRRNPPKEIKPMKTFRYTINGLAAHGQTWGTSGIVKIINAADVFNIAMHESFTRLTEGKAVYGQPGAGCSGPYDISRVLIERVPDD